MTDSEIEQEDESEKEAETDQEIVIEQETTESDGLIARLKRLLTRW